MPTGNKGPFIKFGQLMLRHRKAKKLTRRELAAIISRSQSYIAAIEAGFKVPRLKTLGDLIRALNMGQEQRFSLLNAAMGNEVDPISPPFDQGNLGPFLRAALDASGDGLSQQELEYLLKLQQNLPLVLSVKLAAALLDEYRAQSSEER